MTTEIEKTPAKPTGRKYTSVEEFLGGEAVSQDVRSKVAELKDQTKVVLQLARLRQMAGITQEDMANNLGVTQSAVSKLEAGDDENVTLREVRAYARVTGQRIAVMFGKPLTHVEAVKLHAQAIKLRLESLAEIANNNDDLEKEIKGFFGEAFFNLLNILVACHEKLPNGGADDDDVEIRIEVIKGKQPNLSSVASSHSKHTPSVLA
jgi:transcriptional regulator with XRE-family HTH domain